MGVVLGLLILYCTAYTRWEGRGGVVLLGTAYLVLWTVPVLGVSLYEPQSAELYQLPGSQGLQRQAIYHDELPLRIEDLQSVTYEHYSYEADYQRTRWAALYTGRQHSGMHDSDAPPELRYEIVTVASPYWYERCLEQYLQDQRFGGTRRFQRLERPDWPVEAAYHLWYSFYTEANEYLVCTPGRIVFMDFGWEVSEAELAQAVQILAAFELPEKRGGWTNDEEAAL